MNIEMKIDFPLHKKKIQLTIATVQCERQLTVVDYGTTLKCRSKQKSHFGMDLRKTKSSLIFSNQFIHHFSYSQS